MVKCGFINFTFFLKKIFGFQSAIRYPLCISPNSNGVYTGNNELTLIPGFPFVLLDKITREEITR